MLLNTNEENDHQKNKVIFNTEEIRGPKLDNQKIIHSKREEKEKKKGNENETHEAKEKEKEKQKIEKKPDSKEKNKFQNNIEDKVKEIKKIELKDKLKSLDKLSKEAKRDTIKVKSNGHSQRSTRNIIPEKNSINESKYTLNKINSNKNKIIYTHINDEYKRSFSENSYKEERVLISNFKSHFALSKAGKDDSGNIKINQDSYVIITRINNLKDFNIFGVLDGHGPEGHLVSQFISKYLEVEFHNISGIKKLNDTEKIYSKLSSNDFEIIKKIIINADIALKDQDIDSRTSGTTCVLVIHVGEHIICANTGDSRAVLVFDEKDDEELNYLKVFPLSIDSKPEIPSEKERIINSGGDVEKIRNKFGQLVGPYRVWVKNKDYPGLAMSRSIGDFNAKVVGVIPNPEIIECNLSIYSKYIVICSDGVWEFLSNEDVMNVGKKYYLEGNPKGFCKKLVENSIKFWEKEDIVIDDITVVTIFF
jgi:serine/threonine protein phosphatase PrpC